MFFSRGSLDGVCFESHWIQSVFFVVKPRVESRRHLAASTREGLTQVCQPIGTADRHCILATLHFSLSLPCLFSVSEIAARHSASRKTRAAHISPAHGSEAMITKSYSSARSSPSPGVGANYNPTHTFGPFGWKV